MKAQNPSKSLGEGRDVAPSLAHPSQKQTLVVYTKELTHLSHESHIQLVTRLQIFRNSSQRNIVFPDTTRKDKAHVLSPRS